MFDQEHGVNGVDTRHPHQAAPANVVARSIVLNVHGAKVASLPPKELGNVNRLYKHRDDHGRRDKPLNVVLLHRVTQDAKLPEHHPETTVGKLFYVEPENVGVEVRTPVEVHYSIPVCTRVLGGRRNKSLKHQDQAKDVCEQSHASKEIAQLVIYKARVQKVLAAALESKQCDYRDQIALDTVCVINGNVPRGSHRCSENLSWDETHQQQLKCHVRKDNLPSNRIKGSDARKHRISARQ